jgi:hypothetical protein
MTTVAQHTDIVREIEIAFAGAKVELCHAMLDEEGHDYMGIAGDRDFWRARMEWAIKARSPAQVQRMKLGMDT